MNINVGNADRTLRFILGALLIVLPFTGLIGLFASTTATVIAVVVGIVLVGTASLRFCPLYRLVGASTCSR